MDQALGTPQAAKFGQWLPLITKNDVTGTIDDNLSATIGNQTLLRTHGVWGCLLAGCLLVKTAKYSVSDLNTSLEYVLMAARLFSSVFTCDTIHPTSLCDYAKYTPTHIWRGLDLFGDRYRCNSRTMVDALEFACVELCDAGTVKFFYFKFLKKFY